jgi:hypothetical protein
MMITGRFRSLLGVGNLRTGMATKRSVKPPFGGRKAGHRALVWGASHRPTYHRRPHVPQLCGLTDVRGRVPTTPRAFPVHVIRRGPTSNRTGKAAQTPVAPAANLDMPAPLHVRAFMGFGAMLIIAAAGSNRSFKWWSRDAQSWSRRGANA